MDLRHCTLLLVLFLASWVAVFSQRHSGNIGSRCCKGGIMLGPLNKELFPALKNYVHLPSHGNCPEYLEFITLRGEIFCISPGKAQEMKEFVDVRSKGPTPKDTPSTDSRLGAKEQMEHRKGTPRPTPSPASAPTSPRGYKETPTSSSSTTALPGLHGQETTSTLPSMPPSPASAPTGPQGHKEPPTSSSSTTALPGLHGQERTSTLQSTPRTSTQAQLLQHEDVTTRRITKETYGTTLHPRNIVATMLTSPNKHKAGEDRTTGVTYSPSSTMTGRGGPRMGDEDRPGVGSSPVGEVSDEHIGSSGEADEATGVDQRLKMGLLAAAVSLLLAAAGVLLTVKFKRAPAVLVEGVRYSKIPRTDSETV